MPERDRRTARPGALLLLALATVLRAGGAAADEPPAPRSVLEAFELAGHVDVPVAEVSGLTALPSRAPDVIELLAVGDGATLDVGADAIPDGLFRITLRVRPEGDVVLVDAHVVPIAAAGRLDRVDPAWGPTVPLDLESVVPLPSCPDTFLLSGETNPEDATDRGANRLYVVQLSPASDAPARLVGYLRLPDLPDDLENDRFEAVVALRATTEGTRRVVETVLFKERTAFPGVVPAWVPIRLVEEAGTWSWSRGGAPGRLAERPEVLATQADAALDGAGRPWLLDRWQRRVHELARSGAGGWRIERTWDLLPAIRDVPGETGVLEPPPPGRALAGFGREEALAFDASGRLVLGADRGGGSPSTLTVLVPRGREGPDGGSPPPGR